MRKPITFLNITFSLNQKPLLRRSQMAMVNAIMLTSDTCLKF